ncbi:MAG: triose-phosphate isomerase [Saprospiraceae bacterium]|nr:triose-phosphate isomerase [Saprospiraceae bacterium]MDW8484021.1 triose-phosphate isomerase [Saprospiraceae bacterium]
MRPFIVAGNWKMNKTLEEGLTLVREVLARFERTPPNTTVVFAVPCPLLQAISEVLRERQGFYLAAQNCHHEEQGAYTGEVSAAMLVSVGAQYVILGHSERRQYFRETHEQLARKVTVALRHNLTPIFCCGEPLAVRERNHHLPYVARQLRASLFHLSETDLRRVVIAYEPVWAIGTGKTASSAQAQEMHAAIRQLVAKRYSSETAQAIPILYGGSCNAQNASQLFQQPDVDGGLIGGASLRADEFSAIICAARST